VCSLLEHNSAKSATQMGVGRVIFVCGFAYRPAALSMPRSDVALRNGTGCTGTARLQTEAACQTISTRADLAATFFFAAQATFALILSPYFYQVLWRHRAGADFSRIDARRFAHILRRANLPGPLPPRSFIAEPKCYVEKPLYAASVWAAPMPDVRRARSRGATFLHTHLTGHLVLKDEAYIGGYTIAASEYRNVCSITTLPDR
jgi:hypothetical protein